MKSHAVATNTALVVLHLCLQGLALAGIPLWIRDATPWWPLVLGLVAVTIVPLWALLHEAIHGLLYASRGWNLAIGRLLAVLCYGCPFRAVAVGHLVHHKKNEPEGMGSGADLARTYFQLFTSPYLFAFLGNFLIFVPARFIRERVDSDTVRLLLGRRVAQLRLDAVLVLVVHGGSAWLYGRDAWALAVLFAVRCVLVSFLDGMYHFQPESWTIVQGYNLRLFRPLQALLLNFNLHGAHHQRPGVAWHQLPETHRALGGTYDGGYLAFALRQLRPPRLPAYASAREQQAPRELDQQLTRAIEASR